MKRIASAAALVVAWLSSTVTYAADPCSGFDWPSVTVTSAPYRIAVDHSRSMAQLTEIGKPISPRAAYVTLGLTAVEYSLAVRSGIQMRRVGPDRWCAYPVTVEVEYGLEDPVKVYIARELKRGSCRYRTTMDHEMDHVRIHLAGVERAQRDIRNVMANVIANKMPVSGRTGDEAAKAVRDVLVAAARKAVRPSSNEAKRRNAAIDTPASYEALRRSCPK